MNKLKVTPERWELFEHYHTTYLKTVPNWRLGQAFINFFYKEVNELLSEEDDQRLFYTQDPKEAQSIIDRYIEITELK